jgi:hypothetical protein
LFIRRPDQDYEEAFDLLHQPDERESHDVFSRDSSTSSGRGEQYASNETLATTNTEGVAGHSGVIPVVERNNTDAGAPNAFQRRPTDLNAKEDALIAEEVQDIGIIEPQLQNGGTDLSNEFMPQSHKGGDKQNPGKRPPSTRAGLSLLRNGK